MFSKTLAAGSNFKMHHPNGHSISKQMTSWLSVHWFLLFVCLFPIYNVIFNLGCSSELTEFPKVMKKACI